MGTPAYMAPEQFTGKRVDERTDQFAFCVALYEALYGQRPFAGDTVIVLAASVVHGRPREPKRDSQVPGWVRRAVLRGLDVNPERRFAQLDDLIAVLANDPAKRTRAWTIAGAALRGDAGRGRRGAPGGRGAARDVHRRRGAARGHLGAGRGRQRTQGGHPPRVRGFGEELRGAGLHGRRPTARSVRRRGGRGCTPMPVRRPTSAASSRRRCWISAWRA